MSSRFLVTSGTPTDSDLHACLSSDGRRETIAIAKALFGKVHAPNSVIVHSHLPHVTESAKLIGYSLAFPSTSFIENSGIADYGSYLTTHGNCPGMVLTKAVKDSKPGTVFVAQPYCAAAVLKHLALAGTEHPGTQWTQDPRFQKTRIPIVAPGMLLELTDTHYNTLRTRT